MATRHAASAIGNPVSVHGLEHGRKAARRRSGRRRLKNMIVSGVMFMVAGGVIGGAGYYLWQFYAEEQREALEDHTVVVERDPAELIHDLEDNPRWNGPGAPAFGVGDEQP